MVCMYIVSSHMNCFKMLTVLFLYMTFVLWVFLGSLWIMETNPNDPKCFGDDMMYWYLLFWLVACYVWLFVYSSLFSLSNLAYQARQDYIRRYYPQLLVQYEDDELPMSLRVPLLHSNGLSPRTISRIPVTTDGGNPEDLCSVCLEEIEEGGRHRLLQCGHVFHMRCIDEWLCKDAHCPNCKTDLRTRESEPQEPL